MEQSNTGSWVKYNEAETIINNIHEEFKELFHLNDELMKIANSQLHQLFYRDLAIGVSLAIGIPCLIYTILHV